MANETLTRISPYAERLFDDYVYDELEDAGRKLRAAYGRVSRRPSKAIDDPYVVRLVRDAGESLRNAVVAVTGPPEPPSRKPRILAAAAVTAGTVLLVKRMQAAQAQRAIR
jgi:hypothetical protein